MTLLGLAVTALGALGFFGVNSMIGYTGTSVFSQGDEALPSDTANRPEFFFNLYPDLVVEFNAQGRGRLLKLSITVMSRDEDAIKGVERYHEVLSNRILNVLQQAEFNTVNDRELKNALREIALTEIQRVLGTYGNDNVEDVYFTSFVLS